MFLEKKKSKVVWFTGLSGAGKSTLSNYLSDQLKKLNFTVKKIDGDTFRKKNNYYLIERIKKLEKINEKKNFNLF